MFDSINQSPENLAGNPMYKAGAVALLLHIGLLALLPDVQQLKWSVNTQNQFSLRVTLEQEDQKAFDQSLRNNAQSAQSDASDLARISIAGSAPGQDQADVDESQEVAGSQADVRQSQAPGLNKVNRRSPNALYSYASILKFAKQEAARYADANPRELARFSRSFSSRRQYQKRRKATAHKNQYGDQHINNKGASNGDICFIKTKDDIAKQSGTFDSTGTYTVHFFRCEDKKAGLLKG